MRQEHPIRLPRISWKAPCLVFLLLCFLPGLAACGKGIPPDIPTLPSLRQHTIETGREWRPAYRVPPGAPWVEVGTVPAGTAARLDVGVALGLPAPHEAEVTVYLGNREAGRFSPAGASGWHDTYLELPAPREPAAVRLHIASEQPTFLGPIRLAVPKENAPLLVVFLIDTLRMDHLGAYGYPRDTSPHIDAFAEDAVGFTKMIPQSSWTKPSVASMLTGVYPGMHGAVDKPDRLREGLPHLAKALERAGWRTHWFNTNVNLLPHWGFGEGFGRYVDLDSLDWANVDDARPVDAALEALHESARGVPALLYVHCMGPHDPYTPPPPYSTQFTGAPPGHAALNAEQQQTVNLYDGEIAYTDAQFGRLVAGLKAAGRYDSACIVVLSDHGEQFWEHGALGHGQSLHEEELRVPFLLKLPGNQWAGRTVESLAEMVDAAPTLLALYGLEPEPGFQGRNLLAALSAEDAAPLPPRHGFAALRYKALSMTTVRGPRWKLIDDAVSTSQQWFDLELDRGETQTGKPPDDVRHKLLSAARRLDQMGREGLHVLITCGDKRRKISGEVWSDAPLHTRLDYPDWKGFLTAKPRRTAFELSTHAGPGLEDEHRLWHAGPGEQDHARLVVELEAGAQVGLRVLVDGEPLAKEQVHTPRGTGLPETDTWPPEALAAEPNHFDPAALPRAFAVYLWYVPRTPAHAEETLQPEMREALEGLGYL